MRYDVRDTSTCPSTVQVTESFKTAEENHGRKGGTGKGRRGHWNGPWLKTSRVGVGLFTKHSTLLFKYDTLVASDTNLPLLYFLWVRLRWGPGPGPLRCV